MRKIKLLGQRFWSKVSIGGRLDCWPWRGAIRGPDGYGTIRVWNGQRWKMAIASRAAWELARGKIPPAKQVLHDCDNPACVNPWHLRVGTHRDNMADRQQRNGYARGVDSPLAKMTDATVRRLRAAWARQPRDQRGLARRFGISQTTVWHILQRHTWRHVDA